MRRCRETAAPYIVHTGAELAIEPIVSEIKAPAGVENRSVWLQERFPWRSANPSRTWDTLEPDLNTWRDAMLSFLRGIRQNAAVFTHFIGINVMTGAAIGCERTIVCRPDHASITEIEVSDGGALKLVRAATQMSVDDVR